MVFEIFLRFNQIVESSLQSAFEYGGNVIGRRPKCAIFASLIFAIVCMMGMNNFVTEDRPDKLWIPQDTEAQQDKEKYDVYWPFLIRIEDMVVVPKVSSSNVLERANLEEVLTMWTRSRTST